MMKQFLIKRQDFSYELSDTVVKFLRLPNSRPGPSSRLSQVSTRDITVDCHRCRDNALVVCVSASDDDTSSVCSSDSRLQPEPVHRLLG